MRWLFVSRRVCGSESRSGLPVGRFYVCMLREGHQGDHVGRLLGCHDPQAGGNVLELDRVSVWRRRMR